MLIHSGELLGMSDRKSGSLSRVDGRKQVR
jgi:hypothetical protein